MDPAGEDEAMYGGEDSGAGEYGGDIEPPTLPRVEPHWRLNLSSSKALFMNLNSVAISVPKSKTTCIISASKSGACRCNAL